MTMRRVLLSMPAAFLLIFGAATYAQGEGAARFREMFIQLDANGDTVLDRDEIPESGRAAFDRLLKRGDVNNNGKLEADELRMLGQKLQSLGNPAEMVAERFKAMDSDGDGKVTRSEFKGIAANFDRIDADKDGAITRDELSKFAATQRPNAAALPARPKAKAKARTDNGKKPATKRDEDGKPEPKKDAEAKKPAPPDGAKPEPAKQPRPRADANPARRFREMDKDGDGKLSKSEFAREKAFDRLDADGDGFLTPAELAGQAKIRKT